MTSKPLLAITAAVARMACAERQTTPSADVDRNMSARHFKSSCRGTLCAAYASHLALHVECRAGS